MRGKGKKREKEGERGKGGEKGEGSGKRWRKGGRGHREKDKGGETSQSHGLVEEMWD